MQDIMNAVRFLQAYGLAIENGVERFIETLPAYTMQTINRKAKNKLHSTYQPFMDGVRVKSKEYLFIVEIDPENWLANAVESGIDAFSMKEGLLNSPKAKKGKNGYRYLSIPIGKDKDGPIKGTPTNQEYQKKINEVLVKPKFGMSEFKSRVDGKVAEKQKVLTSEPTLQGFYRTRVFESPNEIQSNVRPKWNYVLFRTVTDNPNSKAKWEHPGIAPANILKETERWLNMNMDRLLEDMIEAELSALTAKMKK